MKRLIFTLVGISLLEEEKGLLGEGKRTFEINLDKKIKKQGNIEAFITDNDSTKVKDLKKHVLDMLAGKNLRDELADFSAEIASLSLLKPNSAVDNKDDKIIFIVTQTPECAFAGIVNGKYIIYRRTNNRDWDSIVFNKSNDVFSCDNVEIKIVEGLQVEKGREFASVGIKNLFTFVSDKIENEGASYDEIIFNITGGYKGTIPYLTLFGMLYQEKEIKGKKIKSFIKYLYEQSEELITLPNLPVAFDIFTWRNYRGFVKTISQLEASVAKLFIDDILPPQIGGLFEKDKLENKYRLTTLGETLDKKYDEEKEGELTPYGRGYLLVDKIKDDDQKPNKRKALQDCINRWQYLWLGDLIPETVEHARGHTQRVLELAAQILYPILNEEENFLGDKDQTSNNLIALISAIWLHDLGHSGDHIVCKTEDGIIQDVGPNDADAVKIQRDIKGFPSMVRGIHHLLSWYLIGKDRKKLFASERNGEWVRNETIFGDDLIEDIRRIGLYHRGKMPVLEKPDPDNPEVENYKPYKHIGIEIQEPLENLSSNKVKLPLLGALLRIADGGDVQEERTISQNYEAMRNLQSKREIGKLEKEEKKYRDILFKNSLFSQSSPLYALKKIANDHFNEKSSNQNKNPDEMKKLESLVEKCVQNYIRGADLENSDLTKGISLHNWLSVLDQYVFKNSPAPHFEKHRGISAVMYLPIKNKTEEENGKKEYHYEVRIIYKKGEDENERKKFKTNANEVWEDISKEYKKVEKILNVHDIYFDSHEILEEVSE